ncbi:MAG: biotin synthase [Methylophilaceae bacterium]|jgi:biotin synthase|tara:strand:+ start:54100 stop:55134 length:1035 start_codon:yes stop_codon:yes gene_type:complete
MLEKTQTSTQDAIINVDELKLNTTAVKNKAERKIVQRWTVEDIAALYEMPLNDLMFKAQTVHRENFDPNAVQVSTLLSIKTGGCSEDCGYCPQAARYNTEVGNEPLMPIDEVLKAAQAAKDSGASRFCMGAAWRSPKQRDLEPVLKMIAEVKAMGLETCATLGMLKEGMAEQLKDAGLDYYNHNLDTAPEFYEDVISTRTYEDRLDTLDSVREADINVCSGGIIGMGETRKQRAGLLAQFANMERPPESVPINLLTQVEGTPMHGTDELDLFEFVRTIAAARITMPKSFVRLSAGRQSMHEGIQAMCFMAGANSIFYGEKLLTTGNPDAETDKALFAKLGLHSI